ncbi:MAG: nucleotide exchange factor GrpE [Phycisphaerae bacterium]|nr:nucleotide exchange factor GrpE [Phycisphaerae bacterium]
MNAEHETDAPEEGPANAESAERTTDPAEIDATLLELGLSDEIIDATPAETRAAMHQLVTERREADDARMRALADFRNFQRRSIENESRARREGTAELVRTLLPALDHFDLALQSSDNAADLNQVVAGVRMVREEIVRAFDSQGIAEINATEGSEFEPGRHEAIGTLPAEHLENDPAPGSIAMTVSAGFAIGDYVLRPAKVMLVAGDEQA